MNPYDSHYRLPRMRIKLEIEFEIEWEFNQSKEKTSLRFSELCFDCSKSNSISILISSLIRALRLCLRWERFTRTRCKCPVIHSNRCLEIFYCSSAVSDGQLNHLHLNVICLRYCRICLSPNLQ